MTSNIELNQKQILNQQQEDQNTKNNQQYKIKLNGQQFEEKTNSKNLCIDVSKPYEQKQIDTRWIQLKMNIHPTSGNNSENNFYSRSYFASCVQAGKVYIHGGYNEQVGILNDMFQAKFYKLPTQWIQLKINSNSNSKNKNKNIPPSLRNHTLCAFKYYLIMFGGQKNMLQNNSDIYRFDLRHNEWQVLKIIQKDNKLEKVSTAIDSHSTHVYNDSMYVFAGYDANKGLYSNSLIKINLKNISQGEVQIQQIKFKQQNKPSPRGNFGSCLVGNQIYVFGGTNSNDIFADFWKLNLQTNQWKQITQTQATKQWPIKRKGQVMVNYIKTNCIFMFGGIRQITKQKNDMMIYFIDKNKWVRIHKHTNQLYEPSPTLKKQIQTSPSILDAKNRKNKNSSSKQKYKKQEQGIKLIAIRNKTITEGFGRNNQNNKEKQQTKNSFYNPSLKTEYGSFKNNSLSKPRINPILQKKKKQFLNRKKKLLDQIQKNCKNIKMPSRCHSPTSETIQYSIQTIGQQKRSNNLNQDQLLPKVIFDQQKGAVIGKKPCARDGHCGLVDGDNIIIVGGDRHMISFKDVYLFRMDKAMQNIHLYE